MKNKILPIIIIIVTLMLVLIAVQYYNNYIQSSNYDDVDNSSINVVASLEDEITDNAAWCGTFNLIWNDLKNDLAKQDIIFEEQTEIVNNLNKGTFTVAELSEDSYYKIYGTPTLELKVQIEKAIKQKFNETSDILNSFDWANRSEKDYFLYCMLKKEFEFPKVFAKLDNGTFGNYDNVKYFGINSSTKEQVREQVEVLYYNSENDFAVKLQTKDNDEVIITVGNNGKNFLDIYNTVIANKEIYEGSHNFSKVDTLKVPYITFNLEREFDEIENKVFRFSNGEPYSIEKALQTIKFELDEKGGRIKSEAGMMVQNESAVILPEKRDFIVDEAFTIFLIEKGKNIPYFAAKITDISAVQSDVNSLVNESNENNTIIDDNNSGNSQVNDEQNKETNRFIGTVLEETTSYMIVEPNEDEAERKSADKIIINYGTDHIDYLYGVGRKVLITYSGSIMESYPAQINTDNIETEGYEDFELSVKVSKEIGKKKILSNTDINKYNSKFDLYYYGLDEVNIKVDGKEMSLEEALMSGKITINRLIQTANKDFPNAITYKDGGSKEYHYDDYTIIKFHSLDGNRDVYIGTKEMTLNSID